MVNPFYVSPGNDYSQGLAGLAQSVQYLGEQKAKQRAEEKYERIKMEATAVFATKDPDKIAKFMIDNPEMARAMEASYSFHSDATKKNYLASAYKILGAHESGKSGTLPTPSTPSTARLPGEFYEPIPGVTDTPAGEYPHSPGETPPEMPLSGPQPPSMESMGMSTEQVEAGLPPEIAEVVDERKRMLQSAGLAAHQTQETDAFSAAYSADPEGAIKKIEHDIATMDPKGWKAWKEIYRPEEKAGGTSNLKKMIDERQTLLDSGIPETDSRVKAYDDRINPKESGSSIAPSGIKKMMGERDDLINSLREQGVEDPEKHPDVLAFQRKIRGDAAKTWKPSALKTMMKEQADLEDELRAKGMSEEEIKDHPYVRAYEMKISGKDIDMKEFSPEEVDFWGAHVLLTGKMPSLGRGKQATKLRSDIARSAAKQAYELFDLQYPGGTATALSAALEAVATSTDSKVIGTALGILEKQKATMGSFITNLKEQIGEAKELAKELPLTDIRLLNVPIRQLYTKVKGDARYSKYHTYLAEISRELSKLAGGATSSIAAMSVEENKVWDRIMDKDLPVKEISSLLDEALRLADIRQSSVDKQLETTRERMRTREIESVRKSQSKGGEYPDVRSKADGGQADFNALKSGDVYRGADGKLYTKP